MQNTKLSRSALKKLMEPQWVQLFIARPDLKVKLVPGMMPDLTVGKLVGASPRQVIRDLVTEAFIDFEGYIDGDGNEVENNFENRLEFYNFPPIKTAINAHLERLNLEAITSDLGEDDAAGD